MKEHIKKGFGLAVGFIVGEAVIKVFAKKTVEKMASNEKFMEYEKINNPEDYEELKKYQK